MRACTPRASTTASTTTAFDAVQRFDFIRPRRSSPDSAGKTTGIQDQRRAFDLRGRRRDTGEASTLARASASARRSSSSAAWRRRIPRRAAHRQLDAGGRQSVGKALGLVKAPDQESRRPRGGAHAQRHRRMLFGARSRAASVAGRPRSRTAPIFGLATTRRARATASFDPRRAPRWAAEPSRDRGRQARHRDAAKTSAGAYRRRATVPSRVAASTCAAAVIRESIENTARTHSPRFPCLSLNPYHDQRHRPKNDVPDISHQVGIRSVVARRCCRTLINVEGLLAGGRVVRREGGDDDIIRSASAAAAR